MANKGRKYLEAAKLVDAEKTYAINDAIALIKKASYAKFDESVELSMRLNVDPRHADQQIRGAIVLPNGSGRTQKVCVIAQGAQEQEAKDAGADFVGGKELIDDMKKGWLDFDVIVATPNMMGELGKIGKILGPKGLMPNPKTGTVTMDVKKAVEDIKKGKVEYRVDKDGNINVLMGKVSFDDAKLVENFNTLYDVVAKARPAAVKGQYFLNITVSSTMGPGVKVAI
ncbi:MULTISPECIES: 50S ribosomal protein L1 [Breznakia]|uniref:Large ribosomal subunit protein uL1 n=1 Tax=Breznakia blatticola TaxID=1754012 RepID=A0A4V3G6U7_9FIRM|nr:MULTISPECIES: 50S ribosomal protein L1 [Breznakia]MDH6366477.1 large subunit ribosomal protein L1 [Breznakia sp. PH1-1]MDH6403570.1 large subunit ribosomal protein L1 [Breznakia sp. PF1-11]MDH6411279.1 large subunit ribosomal protein L1 [Breznakia sp. PFB1-11]MDH6413745.1 large subunit ribosomal protein L1 [Breznakia sp. PFB1-14]MDH6415824.1 large subunit ribosomal protein L1 [Breznakia sp. PFB1-4]